MIIRRAKKTDRKRIESFLYTFPETKVLHHHLPPIEFSIVATTKDGEIIGHAGLDVSMTKMAEVRSMAVSKKYQGMGIAGKILKELEKLAREKKIWYLFADTVAVKFFKKNGYKSPKKGSEVLFKYF